MPCGLLILMPNVAINWPLTYNEKISRWKK